MKNICPALALILLFFGSGCSPFAPEAGLPLPAGIPREFEGEEKAKDADAFIMYSRSDIKTGKWWNGFESRELNNLIDGAINGNFSVKEARARMLQARYQAVKAGAAAYPQGSLEAGLAHIEQENEALLANSLDEWSFGLTAGYELDLWGRIQAVIRGEEIGIQASREDLKTAMMSITGQVTESWIQLISLRKQQDLFKRQLRLQKQLLQLITKRFPLARSTALDIYQQQQAIERIEEALIPLKSREKILKRRIALLLGKSSLEDSKLTADNFPILSDIPRPGLPADLLAARPDIIAAGLRLKAAEWEIAAARADRLPALQLTASHTYSSDQLDSIFDSWLTNLAANLAGPVFDGGRRRAEVARARAEAEERLAVYYRTVFAAVKEVEDALTEEKRYRDTIESLEEQLDLAEKTIREARSRYLNAGGDFLNVLREELNILQVKQDLITAREDMIISRIQLHLALGGDWVDAYAAEAVAG